MEQYWWIIMIAVLIVVGLLKMVIMKKYNDKKNPKKCPHNDGDQSAVHGPQHPVLLRVLWPCMRQDAVYAGKVQSCRLISVPEKPYYTTSFRPCRNSLS